MSNYQSHDGEPGMSDSQWKLERIRLPADLTNLALLDLGCNEGFFCAEATRRGAARVVGIDASADFISSAQGRYGSDGIEFLNQSWGDFPAGTFDVVLWLSSMHYEQDPSSVFARIAAALSPEGLFVLECGVHADITKELAVIPRIDDVPYYPTPAFLFDALSRYFSVRQVGEPDAPSGDPIPRYVFHCKPLKPTVLLVVGASESGKTTLCRNLEPSATKHVYLDRFLQRLSSHGQVDSPLLEWLRRTFDAGRVGSVMEDLDRLGFTQELASLLARNVAPSDRFVVIEGALTPRQVSELTNALMGIAVVWEAERRL